MMGRTGETVSVSKSLLKRFQATLAEGEEVEMLGSFFSTEGIVDCPHHERESEWPLKSKDFPCMP